MKSPQYNKSRRNGPPLLGMILVGWCAVCPSEAPTSEPGPPLTKAQRETWQRQIREALYVPDPLPEIDARSHGTFEPVLGVVAQRVTYATQFGMRVPAIVYSPREFDRPLPGLIIVNGHGGDKYSWYAFYAGMLYARAGAVVLTYDPVGEGERNRERKSGTRIHDRRIEPPEMGQRLGGLMMTDLMQAVTYLSTQSKVDSDRIGAVGYSMGSFVLSLAGAVDGRLHACVLAAGGNLDGPGGYWDNSKPMCQAIPYKAMRFLEDRPAGIYALHASRGPTLLVNGTEDSMMGIPDQGEDLFRTLRQRTIQLHGSSNGVFEFRMVQGISHRPFFVTRQVALWLEQQLDFAHWTKADIETMPTTHVSRWAEANGVEMDPFYAVEQREGGTRALGNFVPPLTRQQLSLFGPIEWEADQANMIYETWVKRALTSVKRSN